MKKTFHKTVVLGGGLAGLSAAYYGRFPVFEAKIQPGGTADSIHKDGFTFDFGIHILNNSNAQFYDLLKKLGVELVTHKRKALIYSYGNYSFYPFQVNTSKLSLSHRLQCVAGYLTRKKNTRLDNYGDWIIQNFGTGFAKNFFIPYAEKFWRVPPKEMTYEWTGPRVPQPSALEVIIGSIQNKESRLGPHAKFHYPTQYKAGFSAIAKALAAKVNNAHYGMNATGIDPYNKTISFNNGQAEIAYKHLIATIPLPELLKLFPTVPPCVQNCLDQLRYNSIAAVNFAIDRPQVSDNHWIHFPEKEISFFRISFPGNFCTGLNPNGTSIIQSEVSYDRKNPPEKDTLIRQVQNDLVRVGVLKPNDRRSFEDVIYQNYGYVIYDRYRRQAVKEIHDFLGGLNIYPCGRYGSWEYLWSDEAIFSGKKTAEKVLQIKDDKKFPELVR